jgi:UDP-N-acetylmuramoyl-tripeptide--D-alanyl-D-alanine ligase
MQKLFPYKLQLQILQQGEYRVGSFLKWILSNFFKRELENKKQLVLSSKAKAIFSLSIVINVLTILILSLFFGVVGFVLAMIISSQAYVFLSLSVLLLKPFEFYLKYSIKQKSIKKLSLLKNLQVIGITGSYGKTSVKEFLYGILKTQYQVLKTPESYNTVLGISKVIDLELDENYRYFICEMGAYKREEIKEIAEMLKPQSAILTGINEQHLEMFGSLKNTVKAKFELIDTLPENGIAVINGDNEQVIENSKKYQRSFVVYGLGDFRFSAKNLVITDEGTGFDLILDGKVYPAKSKLIAKSQIENIVAAATLAFKLGMKPQKIVEAIGNLSAVPHRLEVKQSGNTLIIDDAYNSNVTGFKEALRLLAGFKDREKVIVTPGIVDLGGQTFEIHRELGALAADVCDAVVLVGRSGRTRGLAEGVTDKQKIYWINSIKELQNILKILNFKNPVVLLENDLPDNY